MLRHLQTRSQSLLEAGTNVVVGYLLALATQRIAYPWFGIETTIATDSLVAGIFTAVSLVRSYVLRRAFEHMGGRRRTLLPSSGEPDHART